MIAVIFELEPNVGQEDAYFGLAADLRPLLETMAGFLSIERYESLSTPGRYLSLSFWDSEDAVAQWRNTPDHRAAQSRGRGAILKDYRLRVATVDRDYGLHARQEAPADSCAIHDAR